MLLLPKISQTATQSCTGGGDQVTYGSDSWIGYVYDANGIARDFYTYRGYVAESTPSFDRNWGSGKKDKPSCATNSNGDYFSIRYLMKKNYPVGTYTITHGQDDGTRVFVSNSAITSVAGFSSITWGSARWTSTGTTDYTFEWAGGDMYIVFEYNEVTGGAQAKINICYNGPLQTYGTGGTWNGYYYNATNLDNVNYKGKLNDYSPNTLADLKLNATSFDAAPSGATNCITSPGSTTSFSSRYLLQNNFSRSFYLFTIATDDGVRISTTGPATWNISSSPTSWNIYNGLGWGSTVTTTATAVLDGNTNMVIEHGQGNGGWGMRNQICQMAGDYTLPNYPTWNAYVFDKSTVNDFKGYRGWFNTTSSGTTLIDNNFSSAIPANNGTGTTVTNYTAAGCGFSGPASAGDFSIRYVSRRN